MSELLIAIVSAITGAVVGAIATTLVASIRWRRVQVLAHRARWDTRWETFASPPASALTDVDIEVSDATPGANLHVKIVNRSKHDVEVTHVWLATEPVVDLVSLDSALPARIRPDETHEVWFPIDDLPQSTRLERLARVRLSTGKTLKSRPNNTVPPLGTVARARG